MVFSSAILFSNITSYVKICLLSVHTSVHVLFLSELFIHHALNLVCCFSNSDWVEISLWANQIVRVIGVLINQSSAVHMCAHEWLCYILGSNSAGFTVTLVFLPVMTLTHSKLKDRMLKHAFLVSHFIQFTCVLLCVPLYVFWLSNDLFLNTY